MPRDHFKEKLAAEPRMAGAGASPGPPGRAEQAEGDRGGVVGKGGPPAKGSTFFPTNYQVWFLFCIAEQRAKKSFFSSTILGMSGGALMVHPLVHLHCLRQTQQHQFLNYRSKLFAISLNPTFPTAQSYAPAKS